MKWRQNRQQFALAARGALGFRPRPGDWESSGPSGLFWKVALAVEVLAYNLPNSTSVFAARYSPYQAEDHRVQHSPGFGFPADEPAPILLVDFARATSCVPGQKLVAFAGVRVKDSPSKKKTYLLEQGRCSGPKLNIGLQSAED